ncbi:MAG: penicillin-binding protein activator [Rhodobacterales bacterium]|nr:MAG: penicillin-binding protein activator [Rhodobacterales bacterium]
MFDVFNRMRRLSGVVLALLGMLFLASCGDFNMGGGGPRIDTKRPVPVALLVPGGSGNAGDQALATSLENAARLAMRELSGVNIDLRVYNTAGNAAQTTTVTQQAVRDGAKIILGPVYGGNAAAAGVAAASSGVNVLAFTNNPEVAGGNVFVLGSTFQNTANRLVRFAAAQGKGDLVVVHGKNPAEMAGLSAINRAVAITPGARIVAEVPFEMSQTGVINAVPKVSSALRNSGAKSVFLTSGTDGAIPFLAGLLPENGVKPTDAQFIGLQRWDVPVSARSLPGLQGGWFALPDPSLAEQFQQRYLATYGAAPHAIAGLAYDGIAAIGALVKAGKADALTGAALTQPQGFAGVNGVFRLRGDGTNQRALAVAQIQNQQIVIIDAAPRSFGGGAGN